MRFQCPFPKILTCSFCQKRNVLTNNCDCVGARDLRQPTVDLVHEAQEPPLPEVVLEPRPQFELAQPDNLIVVVDNDYYQPQNELADSLLSDNEDADILEINADSDSLE